MLRDGGCACSNPSVVQSTAQPQSQSTSAMSNSSESGGDRHIHGRTMQRSLYRPYHSHQWEFRGRQYGFGSYGPPIWNGSSWGYWGSYGLFVPLTVAALVGLGLGWDASSASSFLATPPLASASSVSSPGVTITNDDNNHEEGGHGWRGRGWGGPGYYGAYGPYGPYGPYPPYGYGYGYGPGWVAPVLATSALTALGTAAIVSAANNGSGGGVQRAESKSFVPHPELTVRQSNHPSSDETIRVNSRQTRSVVGGRTKPSSGQRAIAFKFSHPQYKWSIRPDATFLYVLRRLSRRAISDPSIRTRSVYLTMVVSSRTRKRFRELLSALSIGHTVMTAHAWILRPGAWRDLMRVSYLLDRLNFQLDQPKSRSSALRSRQSRS